MHIYIYPYIDLTKLKFALDSQKNTNSKKKKEKINLYHLSVHRIRSEVQNEGLSEVKSL